MNKSFTVSAAPHLHEKCSVASVMWQVVLALMPALGVAIMFFGINSLFLTIYGVAAAVITEALIQKFRKIPVTVTDGSAVVTGILVSFNIHAASPWWLPVVGSVFAIAVGKQVFGGLGYNPLNPALLARAFMVASWPTLTTSGWDQLKITPLSGITNIAGLSAKAQTLITSATPLNVAKTIRDVGFLGQGETDIIMNKLAESSTIQNLFWGNIGGVIGEVSAVALLLGAVYLSVKHIIEWRIPISYIGTVFVLTYIFGGVNGLFSAPLLLPVFHIFAGGLILGAFFMATDMVTSPVTKKGRLLYGIGCGILTVVIRLKGGYPEGVSYSILLMNVAVPLIDQLTVPKAFGGGKQ
ncbi:MAG: RnfABCDGE type electron transport complex subunit D [Candidatus Cloacimonetes bacterium]|nr:RnfABCDGE type electron transport complex subunit D [Candidatus Cloacimonadota bacterium]